jgi:hypothetical protein
MLARMLGFFWRSKILHLREEKVEGKVYLDNLKNESGSLIFCEVWEQKSVIAYQISLKLWDKK